MNRLFTRILIGLGSFIVMIIAGIFIVFVHIFKLASNQFLKTKVSDPFHDSRRHPLNDPGAPRG